MSLLSGVDAVTLDVGGVFVVPNHDRLAAVLAEADLAFDRERFWDGHYRAMHAVDSARSAAESFQDYVPAFCHHLGFHDDEHGRAVEAVGALFGPSGLWTEPIAESAIGIRALDEAGVAMAIVSNADGTVADVLRDADVCQEGDGPLVRVAAVVDSGVIGIAKPHPAIFTPALEALGTAPERTLHVGDSVHYDVEGARAAGLQAVHFDPRRLCPSDEHGHVRALTDLIGPIDPGPAVD
ncbi:MAG: HAD family hydrolase [Acidimicrobiales bacterium]|nr:HAD family hydrolase [Acidimicrobiales bacterium]